MRCKGTFKNDRTCDMCKLVSVDAYEECIKENEESIKYRRQLNDIKNSCPYRTISYDEYTPFQGCNKYSNGYGRFADECCPSLECENITK